MESLHRNGAKRKREHTSVKVACESCRGKKSKCDGVRPSCSECEKRNTKCTYDTKHESESRRTALRRENEFLKQRNEELQAAVKGKLELEELFKLLRDLTYDKGLEVLEQLKHKDPSEVLQWFGPLLQSPVSPHPTAQTLLPPMSSRLEYELTATHSNAYPALVSSVDGVPLCQRTTENGSPRGDLAPILIGARPVLPVDQVSDCLRSFADPSRLTTTTMSSLPEEQAMPNGSIVYGPARAQKHCDPRLSDVDISNWTDVHVSNESALRLIDFYLRTDHACLPFFDADLFLEGLASGKTEFCTPFLANAVLLHASVAYTANNLRLASLTPAFRRTVERLWATERLMDSIPTVAAASMLQVTYSQICEDKLAADFGEISRAMVARLQLLSKDGEMHQPSMYWSSSETLRAASYTAWGIFNLSSLWTFYLHDVAPYKPPDFPIPGDQNHEAHDWLTPRLPEYMGQTFTSLCKFWKIAHKFIEQYYSNLEIPIIARISLASMETHWHNLDGWANEHLSANGGWANYPHEAAMRIYYHLVIIELVRPFAEAKATFLRTFSYREHPKAVLRSSVNQLKRYVRDYRHMIGTDLTTMILQPALFYVANALIADLTDPDCHFYLQLCFNEHVLLSLQYPLASVLLEGLLAMAAEKKVLTLENAKAILDQAKVFGVTRTWANASPGGTKFVADHSLALTDHVGSRIDALSEHFRDRLMFHELTKDDSGRSSACVS